MVAHCHAEFEIAYLSRIEIHQIRYFLAVCEHLNFTQAARHCHVTQPSRTRAIQRLEAQAAKKGAKEYGVKSPMRLNLSIMRTIAPALLIHLFSRFRAAHPDIQLDLIDGTAQSIEEQLIGAKAEAAVYFRPDRARDPRLNYLPLFREQMMIVLPAGHRLAGQETIAIRDLAGEPYVQRSFCEFNDMVDRVFDDIGVDLEVSTPAASRKPLPNCER